MKKLNLVSSLPIILLFSMSIYASDKGKSVISALIPDSLGNSTWGLEVTKRNNLWTVNIGPMIKPGQQDNVDTLTIKLKKDEYLTNNNCLWEKHGDKKLIIAAKEEFKKPFKAWFIDTKMKKIIPINAKEVKCWPIEDT